MSKADDRWVPTHFRAPRTGEAPLYVRFRNGYEPTIALPANKWRFDDTGSRADIIAVRKA